MTDNLEGESILPCLADDGKLAASVTLNVVHLNDRRWLRN
jgi:hypothetical protein